MYCGYRLVTPWKCWPYGENVGLCWRLSFLANSSTSQGVSWCSELVRPTQSCAVLVSAVSKVCRTSDPDIVCRQQVVLQKWVSFAEQSSRLALVVRELHSLSTAALWCDTNTQTFSVLLLCVCVCACMWLVMIRIVLILFSFYFFLPLNLEVSTSQFTMARLKQSCNIPVCVLAYQGPSTVFFTHAHPQFHTLEVSRCYFAHVHSNEDEC